MNWRLQSNKALGLVGGWSLFRSPRPASPTDFLSPFSRNTTDLWLQLIGDCSSFPQGQHQESSTSGGGNGFREISRWDKWMQWMESKAMCGNQKAVTNGGNNVGRIAWHVFLMYFSWIQMGVACDRWRQAKTWMLRAPAEVFLCYWL